MTFDRFICIIYTPTLRLVDDGDELSHPLFRITGKVSGRSRVKPTVKRSGGPENTS
jgi:hypothetical protein